MKCFCKKSRVWHKTATKTQTKFLATLTISKVRTTSRMAIAQNLAIESYTKLALAQFITVFGNVCKEKSMVLKTHDGVEVKNDLLHRMLYEASTNNTGSGTKVLEEDQAEDFNKKEGKTTETVIRPRDVCADGIKINYKDLKKVEKKHKIQFPFMPDLVDYVCENTACQSLRVCGNLFLPCGTNVKNWTVDGDSDVPICKTCMKQENPIRYGTLGDRIRTYEAGEVYEAPEKDDASVSSDEEGSKKVKAPKKEVTFATYLAKKGDLGNDAKQRNGHLSEKISDLEGLIQSEFHMEYKFNATHFTIDKTKVRGKKDGEEKKRGRPKKERSASVSSTDEENEIPEASNVEEPVAEVEKPVAVEKAEQPSEKKEHALEVVAKVCENLPKQQPKKKRGPAKKKTTKKDEGSSDGVEEKSKKTPKKKVEKKKVEKKEEEVQQKQAADEELDNEPLTSDGEDQEEEETRNLREFEYNGKKYLLDTEDKKTVYNQDSEYVGDLDLSSGKIDFVEEEE